MKWESHGISSLLFGIHGISWEHHGISWHDRYENIIEYMGICTLFPVKYDKSLILYNMAIYTSYKNILWPMTMLCYPCSPCHVAYCVGRKTCGEFNEGFHAAHRCSIPLCWTKLVFKYDISSPLKNWSTKVLSIKHDLVLHKYMSMLHHWSHLIRS